MPRHYPWITLGGTLTIHSLALLGTKAPPNTLIYENKFNASAALLDWAPEGCNQGDWALHDYSLLHGSTDTESDPVVHVYDGTPLTNNLRHWRVSVDGRMENATSDAGTLVGHAGIVFGHQQNTQANACVIIAGTDSVVFFDFNEVGFAEPASPNNSVTVVDQGTLDIVPDVWYSISLDVDLDSERIVVSVVDPNGSTLTHEVNNTTTPSFSDLRLNGTGQFGVIGFHRSHARFDNFQIFDMNATCEGDINGDDVVNVSDLLILLANWGSCAP